MRTLLQPSTLALEYEAPYILCAVGLHATIRGLFPGPHMDLQPRTDLFHGLFRWHPAHTGTGHITRHDAAPRTVPDPQSGIMIKVASVEVTDRAICPACAHLGAGGFVSFVSDLRLAYACPACRQLVWLPGA